MTNYDLRQWKPMRWINVCQSFTSRSGGKTALFTREIVCCPCERSCSLTRDNDKWQITNPLFRYFYYPLSNYTKTIIRLRLVNIGEYSPRLRLGEYSPIFTAPSANKLLIVIQHYCDCNFVQGVTWFYCLVLSWRKSKSFRVYSS